MTNKTNKINKILNLIKKMEDNHFLLPDGWSNETNMISRSATFKTYVGGRGDFNRYINIEYKTEEIDNLNLNKNYNYNIMIRRNEIFLEKKLGEVKNEIDLVLDIIKSIYKEKTSFQLMDKEVFKKRLRLKELKGKIKTHNEEVERIKKELKDKKKLIK